MASHSGLRSSHGERRFTHRRLVARRLDSTRPWTPENSRGAALGNCRYHDMRRRCDGVACSGETDEPERRLRQRLDALGLAPSAELLHVLMLADFGRADRIGEFRSCPESRASLSSRSLRGGSGAPGGAGRDAAVSRAVRSAGPSHPRPSAVGRHVFGPRPDVGLQVLSRFAVGR
jgi:hypothetical protein